MKCICGYTITAELAAGTDNTCISCGRSLMAESLELLSNPALGLVTETRAGQIEFARVFEEMLKEQGHCCAMLEGGCGVGKTFAYGVPAILNGGGRVVISTGKKSLQDQLSRKDMPYLQSVLGKPDSIITLKGKSNYICKRLLEKNFHLFEGKHIEKKHTELTKWAEGDDTGDLDNYGGGSGWPVSACTAEDCTRCHHDKEGTCGYRLLRAKAKIADVLIINHSLLGFDLRIGNGRIFGAYNLLIVDEAHQAPGFIRNAFSRDLTPTWLPGVYDKIHKTQIDIASEGYRSNQQDVEAAWAKMFEALPLGPLLETGFLGEAGKEAALQVRKLRDDLDRYVLRRWWGHDVEALIDGTSIAGKNMVDVMEDIQADLYRDREEDPDAYDDFTFVQKHREKLDSKAATIDDTYDVDDNWINSRETTSKGMVRILRQPVVLAPLISGSLRAIDKVLFTSATLNTDSLKAELGVLPKYELIVPSPFPYNRSLIYLPKHLPRPDDAGWHEAIAEEIVILVRASHGNALVLFSSMKDLDAVKGFIETQYTLEYPLLCQGDGRRPAEVFAEYLRTDNAVLFGSKSFFEGIDVQGEKLSLVIIPKIPFPPREDPLNKAKERVLGRNHFWSKWYYPNMLQDIQQAAGRLIRTVTDRGVVAILDVRMWVGGDKEMDPQTVGTSKVPWKGYGHRIIQALPFSNVSPRRELVLQVFENIHKQNRKPHVAAETEAE